MKTEFKSSFTIDLRDIRETKVLDRIRAVIATVEQVDSLNDVPHVTKLQGEGDFYRTRVGD